MKNIKLNNGTITGTVVIIAGLLYAGFLLQVSKVLREARLITENCVGDDEMIKSYYFTNMFSVIIFLMILGTGIYLIYLGQKTAGR